MGSITKIKVRKWHSVAFLYKVRVVVSNGSGHLPSRKPEDGGGKRKIPDRGCGYSLVELENAFIVL